MSNATPVTATPARHLKPVRYFLDNHNGKDLNRSQALHLLLSWRREVKRNAQSRLVCRSIVKLPNGVWHRHYEFQNQGTFFDSSVRIVTTIK